jgi:hypothetical protein
MTTDIDLRRKIAALTNQFATLDRSKYSDDLDGFHSYARVLTEVLFEVQGSVAPLVVADMADSDKPLIIAFSDGRPLEFFLETQDLLEQRKAIRAAKITEQWTSLYPVAEGIPANAPRPSQDPNRGEAVTVVTRDRSGKRLRSLADIIRPADGPPHLAPWESDSTDAPAGALLGIVTKQ